MINHIMSCYRMSDEVKCDLFFVCRLHIITSLYQMMSDETILLMHISVEWCQAQITSCHIALYHIKSCTISCNIISYYIISYHIIIWCQMTFVFFLHEVRFLLGCPAHFTSYRIMAYHFISYHIISYQVMSYYIKSCYAWRPIIYLYMYMYLSTYIYIYNGCLYVYIYIYLFIYVYSYNS